MKHLKLTQAHRELLETLCGDNGLNFAHCRKMEIRHHAPDEQEWERTREALVAVFTPMNAAGDPASACPRVEVYIREAEIGIKVAYEVTLLKSVDDNAEQWEVILKGMADMKSDEDAISIMTMLGNCAEKLCTEGR